MQPQIFMQILHVHLGQNQLSIYSLNLVQVVSGLILPGNWFHISGPNIFRLFAQYVIALQCLTRTSFGLTLACSLSVNISFIQFELRLLTVLKNFNGQDSYPLSFHPHFLTFFEQDIIITLITGQDYFQATFLNFLNFFV